MMSGRIWVRMLMPVAAALLLQACGGEAAQQPGEDGAVAAGPKAVADTPIPQPAPVPSPSVPQASRKPAAPYLFTHARFLQAWDDQGNPLGLKVESVLPGGRVALAGIQVDDIIHAIDGVAMDDPASFDRAVRMAEDIFRERRPQHFVVTRDGGKIGLMPLGAVKSEPVSGE